VKTAEFYRDRFYATRPILGRMSEVWPHRFQKDPVDVRKALLGALPLGSERSNVIQNLSVEGFHCQPSSILGKGWTDCQLRAPAGAGGGHTNWILDFQFDAEDRLTDVRIVIQPISL
jgi:hypothetical protein